MNEIHENTKRLFQHVIDQGVSLAGPGAGMRFLMHAPKEFLQICGEDETALELAYAGMQLYACETGRNSFTEEELESVIDTFRSACLMECLRRVGACTPVSPEEMSIFNAEFKWQVTEQVHDAATLAVLASFLRGGEE